VGEKERLLWGRYTGCWLGSGLSGCQPVGDGDDREGHFDLFEDNVMELDVHMHADDV
jgi:hypothetical protein